MIFEVIRKYMKYTVFILVFVVGTFVNYQIQKSVGVSSNVLTILIPGVVGGVAGWHSVQRMHGTRKL